MPEFIFHTILKLYEKKKINANANTTVDARHNAFIITLAQLRINLNGRSNVNGHVIAGILRFSQNSINSLKFRLNPDACDDISACASGILNSN